MKTNTHILIIFTTLIGLAGCSKTVEQSPVIPAQAASAVVPVAPVVAPPEHIKTYDEHLKQNIEEGKDPNKLTL